MKRKTIATIVILLAYFFPFRYAFLEVREFKMINGVWVSQHELYYIINFLLVTAAALFYIYAINDDREKTRMEKLQHAEVSKSMAAA